MKIGLLYWATDETIRPGEFARMAEERGFHSIFLGEHTHVPVAWSDQADGHDMADPPVRNSDGSEPPIMGSPEYKRFLDQMTALTAAASATTTIRIGTAVCLVAQHDPLLLAK